VFRAYENIAAFSSALIVNIADIFEIDLALADKDDYSAGPDQLMMIRSLE
jgi:hypothetical protein